MLIKSYFKDKKWEKTYSKKIKNSEIQMRLGFKSKTIK